VAFLTWRLWPKRALNHVPAQVWRRLRHSRAARRRRETATGTGTVRRADAL